MQFPLCDIIVCENLYDNYCILCYRRWSDARLPSKRRKTADPTATTHPDIEVVSRIKLFIHNFIYDIPIS